MAINSVAPRRVITKDPGSSCTGEVNIEKFPPSSFSSGGAIAIFTGWTYRTLGSLKSNQFSGLP